MKLSDWLQQEMNKRHWSQSDLARASGLHRAVINKLMNGNNRFPRPQTLNAIARAFKIPAESIYRATGVLPPISEDDTFVQELIYKFQSIRNPQRRMTALNLLETLLDEEESEQSTDSD